MLAGIKCLGGMLIFMAKSTSRILCFNRNSNQSLTCDPNKGSGWKKCTLYK